MGIFLVVVLSCSTLVVCYAIRAIRTSFQHALFTESDIVFYNARNVNNFPASYIKSKQPIYQQTYPPKPGYGVVKYPIN